MNIKIKEEKLTARALTSKVEFGFWHQDRVNYKANKVYRLNDKTISELALKKKKIMVSYCLTDHLLRPPLA